MITVDISITGDKATIKALKEMGAELLDWSAEFDQAAKTLVRIFEVRQFETLGDYLGMRWASLSPSYEARKRAKGGRDILELTGTMRHSWDSNSTKDTLSIGNTSDYAVFHQLGTKFMPARPLINVNDNLKEDIGKIFKSGLELKLRRAFSQAQ